MARRTHMNGDATHGRAGKRWALLMIAILTIAFAVPVAAGKDGACQGGMEMTAAKKCACPAGKVWSGLACVAPAAEIAKKEDGEKRCKPPRAAGKWPDCCPVWAPNFREGK